MDWLFLGGYGGGVCYGGVVGGGEEEEDGVVVVAAWLGLLYKVWGQQKVRAVVGLGIEW